MEHPVLFWLFNGLVVTSVSALTIYCARMRQGSGQYLCEDCRFNDAKSCLKKERPLAVVCTSYRNKVTTAHHARMVPADSTKLPAPDLQLKILSSESDSAAILPITPE